MNTIGKSVVSCIILLATLFIGSADASERIYFDTAKSDIKQSEMQKLQDAAKRVKSEKLTMVLVGHADQRGGRVFNLELGQRRAAAVRAALLDLGVDPSHVDIFVSYGKERSNAPDDMLAEHLAANRNVEIIMVKPRIRTIGVPVPGPTVTREKEVPVYRKNRIRLLGGVGPNGVLREPVEPNCFKFSQDFDPVFGVGYTRNLDGRLNIGIEVFSNYSAFLGLGVDF